MKHLLRTAIFLISIASILISFDQTATAQSLTTRHSPQLMQGMRPLGMGGAFVAVKGTDENVLFYNPAAINDYEKKVHMQFLLPTVEISYKAIDFFANDLLDLADDINGAADNTAKINVFNNFAAVHTGRYEEIGLRGPLAVFMHKYLTAALFYENRSVMALLNAASTTIDLESNTTGGIQFGSAYSFFDDKLQVGVAAKVLGRHLIDEQIAQRDIIANDNFGDAITLDDVGYGVGFDLGVKGKIPWSAKAWEYLDPTFAITVQDIGHTRFFAGDDVGRIPESLTAGAAFHPDFWKLKSILAFDMRDLDRRSDFLNKLHVGYELTWPEISKILRSVALRGGVNQGYIGGGLGLDFKYFKLNATTYGREIGERTRQKQSRMIGVQLAAGF